MFDSELSTRNIKVARPKATRKEPTMTREARESSVENVARTDVAVTDGRDRPIIQVSLPVGILLALATPQLITLGVLFSKTVLVGAAGYWLGTRRS